MDKEMLVFVRETIELIPETGCSRQERILLNAFVRPRLKLISAEGLMLLAFNCKKEHLLSFYELSERLVLRELNLKELLCLMKLLCSVRNTRKIKRMYWRTLEELDRQIKTGEAVAVVCAVSHFGKGRLLPRRILGNIEELLAMRADGLSIGEKIAPVVPNFSLPELKAAVARLRKF